MRTKTTAWMLWCASWMLPGLHRFYLGKPLSGVLYLCTWNLCGVGMLMDAFTLGDMVDDANTEHMMALGMGEQAMRPQLGMPTEQVMQRLLRAAEKRGGVITMTESVMETGLSFAELEDQFTKMMKKGICVVDNHPETGVVLYRFPELETVARGRG